MTPPELERKTAPFAPIADDRCPHCGGTHTGDLDLKSVRANRDKRYMELKLQHGQAVLEGMTHKIWKTVGGPTVRDSHKQANRQRVGIQDHFTVGGHKLFLLADPDAPWSETANCRCDVIYEKEEVADCSLPNDTGSNEIIKPIALKYPIFGSVRPSRGKFGQDQEFDFIAGRKIRVEATVNNATPVQLAAYFLQASATPLDQHGKDMPTIYDPDNADFYVRFNKVGYFNMLIQPDTKVFDAGYKHSNGWHWRLKAQQKIASDNQGPITFKVVRDGE